MNYLFDELAPQKKKKAAPPRAAVVEEDDAAFAGPPPSRAVVAFIGQINDTFDCGDGACGSQCHDILIEERGQWYVSCAFCGTCQWVIAIVKKEEKPKDEVFRLREGRFPGMTFDEIAQKDGGLPYIQWVAVKGFKESVREEAQKWLAKKHMDDKNATA